MKDKIRDIVSQCINNFEKNVADNLMVDCVEYDKASFSGWDSNYHPEDDIYKLLLDIGVILENETLINMFKEPKTIQEIAKEANEENICEFEELEEIETTRDANSDSKYIYLCKIFKHKPTNKFYSFTMQTARDGTRIALGFEGEVEKKEIVQTVLKNK